MLLTESVDIKWTSSNVRHYLKHGYKFIKYGGIFNVKTTDLLKSSKAKVLLKCDSCLIDKEVLFVSYTKTKCFELFGLGVYYCIKCVKNKIDGRTNEEFKSQLFDLVGNDYTALTDYTQAHAKIKFIHNICEYEFESTANSVLRGTKCPQCHGNIKKTNEEFLQQVFDKVGDEYTFLEEYINTNAGINVKHNPCGNIYNVLPSNFLKLKGTRCARCSESHGERTIRDYLEINNIKYESQYKFIDCKNKFELPFDFATFDNNENLTSLIEYDGEQHYIQKDFFGGEKGFKKQKKNDKIKTDYCVMNNIKLIRIPYFEFKNIENILKTAYESFREAS